MSTLDSNMRAIAVRTLRTLAFNMYVCAGGQPLPHEIRTIRQYRRWADAMASR